MLIAVFLTSLVVVPFLIHNHRITKLRDELNSLKTEVSILKLEKETERK